MSHEADRALARFRRVLGAATLLMLGLSWPLWVETTDFPRVPFARGLDGVGAAASWGVYGLLLVSVALVAAGAVPRIAAGAGAGLLVGLVLLDQHRFQPWAYQYGLTCLALALAPPARALGLARLFIVALYFHSALSKLDVSFLNELGRTFLDTAARPFGLRPERWPDAARNAAILAMPAWELAVALGLLIRRTRPFALGGAVVQHLALLAILGPLGLGHSTIVLIWNVALIAEDLVLFRAPAFAADADAAPPRFLERLVRLAFVLAAALPLGERWGVFDSWPSFALYASHTERTYLLVEEENLPSLPPAVRRHVVGPGATPWGRLDLTGWSRAVRGVPVYPQARACHGLVEALASRHPAPRPWRVVHLGRADRWTGRREERDAVGLAAIRALGDRFRLNGHPAVR